MGLAGISHIGVTVSDLDRSAAWYTSVLGWTEQARGRGDTSSYAAGALPGGVSVVLRQHDAGLSAAFVETQAGLDHLSLAGESVEDLLALQERLRAAGVTPEQIKDEPYGYLLGFRDPDNIALEAMAPKKSQ